MSKIDKTKVARTSLHNQEMSLDKMPHKSTRKAKKKERQAGKKEIRDEYVVIAKPTNLGQQLIKGLKDAIRYERGELQLRTSHRKLK